MPRITNSHRGPQDQPATHDDVHRILGPVEDGKCAAIVASGATLGQLEEAAAWLAGESDEMAELERSMVGVVADIYEIITADEDIESDL